mgnify:CR=1 FL=1
MKNFTIFLIIIVVLASCAQSVTTQQAANRNYRGTRALR